MPNKLCFIAFGLCFLSGLSYGQKTELIISASGGIFYFRGNGSASNSSINYYYSPGSGQTAIPYGRENDFSFAFDGQVQRLTKNSNIYGMGIGFEALKSKVRITEANLGSTLTMLVNGNSTLRNEVLTLSPYIGHRFSDRKIFIDLMVGLEWGLWLGSKEEVTISPNPENLPDVENNLPKPVVDFGPNVQFKVQYKRYGLIAGYYLGLTNYQTEGNLKAYSNFLGFGLSYQLK